MKQSPVAEKPLGRRAYGSIGHLPSSRLGPADHCISDGQARICTEKTRDRFDRVIVQEKLDGSCCAVAFLNGKIHALNRAGWPVETSPYLNHRMFGEWVRENEERFRDVLLYDGERIVGEWLAMAHGTLYDLSAREPFGVFDIMLGETRLTYDDFALRVAGRFTLPHLLSDGPTVAIESAMEIHSAHRWPSDGVEGVVYRVERKGRVDFLAKYVRHDKVDGKYLPEVSGGEAVWNWLPKTGVPHA